MQIMCVTSTHQRYISVWIKDNVNIKGVLCKCPEGSLLMQATESEEEFYKKVIFLESAMQSFGFGMHKEGWKRINNHQSSNNF